MAKRKLQNTKLSIMHCAMKLFLEKGYTETYITTISKTLEISTGNLTFHFPTKEHLLAEIVKEMFAFQTDIRTGEQAEEVMAYLRELAIISAICDGNAKAKDLMTAAYTHSMSLEVIRVNDSQKAMKRFGKYCPDWTTEDFIRTENVVSGIEYALLMTENAQMLTLEQRLRGSLDIILRMYQVPEEERLHMIDEVMSIDYRNIGYCVFERFCDYVEEKTDS